MTSTAPVSSSPATIAPEGEGNAVLDALLDIARDLATSRPAKERFHRLVGAVHRVFACDAVVLMRFQGGVLVPVAAQGLVPDAMGRRFAPADHPRLAAILGSRGPVRFDAADRRPDPLYGLLSGARMGIHVVHSYLGLVLRLGEAPVGILALCSLDSASFDWIDDEALSTLGALAAATMKTARFDALEETVRHCQGEARRRAADAGEGEGVEIVGESEAIGRVKREIDQVATSDLAVLVTGETGVGKELVARRIHALSSRAAKPLVYVNCAALPESLSESELFGHERGAFTGAASERAGKFELADGGTILLDEIGELPASIQPKLLRVLQDGEIQRVGSDRYRRTDVRVIAATNRDLRHAIDSGRFRADLFHRLSVLVLSVPPLRERGGDAVLLGGYFLERAQRQLGVGTVRLTPGARDALAEASWPGNVRELEHVMLRAVLRATGGRNGEPVEIHRHHLDIAGKVPVREIPSVNGNGLRRDQTLTEATTDFQRALVLNVLAACNGNWAEAARHLGVDRSNLHRLARRLGLQPVARVVDWTRGCPNDHENPVV